MASISEKVNKNRRRIWGSFKLSDGSTTQYEIRKGDSWSQWGNTTENLSLTVGRVTELCDTWMQEF